MTDHLSYLDDDVQSDRTALFHSIEVLCALAERSHTEDIRILLTALSEKLKRDRFNLAILGQMKRGKSSFVNALLGAEILPTGILPLTSVITRVRYGSTPAAEIVYKSGQSEAIELHALHEYITEAANPGNRKQVASAEVAYPSELLHKGIDLIDTPGIGSTYLHNTSTTEDYLNEIDAGIVVLSVDPPITEVELDFLRRIRQDIPKLLFVINKADIVSPDEVETVRRFLESEIRNRIGIEPPELFPFSARQALQEQKNLKAGKTSGLEPLAERLHRFASEERERTLLQSIAFDVLRIAETLRFTALVGERVQAMSGEELNERKHSLEAALSSCDQEFKDLRFLLRQDTASIVAKVEKELKDHVAAAIPAAHERLTTFKKAHPAETRQRLGKLLDQFLYNEVKAAFDGWCAKKDESVRTQLADLSSRFIERTNAVLERLQDAAGTLFEVPVTHIHFTSELTMESHLYYHTDPVFLFQLDKLIFVLPKFLLRRIVFRRMFSLIETELQRNSGRIRYDYVQRLEKSVATFEQELKAAVGIVAANLRRVLQPDLHEAQSGRETLAQLDLIIVQCSVLLARSDRTSQPLENAAI